MPEMKIGPRDVLLKTMVVHTLTYFLAGLLAFTLLDYGRRFSEPPMNAFMRPTEDRLVMAGLLFQPLRGLLFGLAFYPLRSLLFGSKRSWLTLWLLLIVLGVLSTFGPSPGSIEGMIYSNWPLRIHLIGLPEVIIQALLLSWGLHFWITHAENRWISRILWFVFIIALSLPLLGLLVGKPQSSV